MSTVTWASLAALAPRRVHVLGLAGTEGAAMTAFLHAEGLRDMTVHDMAEGDDLRRAFLRNHVGIPKAERLQRWETLSSLPLTFRLGDAYLSGLSDAEAIFLPQAWYLYEANLAPVEDARARGVPCLGLMDLYFGLSPAPVVAITGSNGKSTTSRALERMLRIAAEAASDAAEAPDTKDDGPASPLPPPSRIYYAGNERRSVQVLDQLRDMTSTDRLVLEVSNRHLREHAYAPRIGAITNVLPNHLDEHGDDPAAYAAAKRRLLDTQAPTDAAILNADDPVSRSLAAGLPGRLHWFSRLSVPETGAWLAEGEIRLRLDPDGPLESAGPIEASPLPGAHNQENLLAAALAARLAGADPASIAQGIAGFTGLRHRIQFVWGADGVSYYDDLNSTTPQATLAAIAALDGDLVLLAGGDDKGLDLDALAEAIQSRVRLLILLPGPGGDRIAEATANAGSGTRIERYDDFAAAVRFAMTESLPGESVLLSPACPYFFRRNYLSGGKEVGFKALLRKGLDA